jgi:hypothetical protein
VYKVPVLAVILQPEQQKAMFNMRALKSILFKTAKKFGNIRTFPYSSFIGKQ